METGSDPGFPYPLKPYPKLIINAAITGMVPTKEDTPHIPLSPGEIVEDVRLCSAAGASVFHIHARDESGEPTYKKEVYAEIIEGIRSINPDLIVCVTTSGRKHKSLDQRSEVLGLDGGIKPDMASLTMGSMNFSTGASLNSPEIIEALALKMKDRGIVPEIEIFEAGMINTAQVLIKKGVLDRPFFANLILGSIYSAPGSLFSLTGLVKSLPQGFTWAAAAIGRFQLKMNCAAMLMGGHVRVGLEDNIYYDQNRKIPATNEMLIKRVVRFASEIEREIATPAEAREMIGLTVNKNKVDTP